MKDFIEKNNPWATIYYETEIDASKQIKDCISISEKMIEKKSRILKKITN